MSSNNKLQTSLGDLTKMLQEMLLGKTGTNKSSRTEENHYMDQHETPEKPIGSNQNVERDMNEDPTGGQRGEEKHHELSQYQETLPQGQSKFMTQMKTQSQGLQSMRQNQVSMTPRSSQEEVNVILNQQEERIRMIESRLRLIEEEVQIVKKKKKNKLRKK